MKQVTKTLLHKLGYRKSKDSGCYWKCRLVNRPEGAVKARVQVKLFNYGWFDVNSQEDGEYGGSNHSSMLRGIKQLKEWEKFAFCK